MKTVRIVNRIFLVVSLCLLLAMPVIGIWSGATNWDGNCYGFTDGKAPCSQWEFTQNEMFWSAFLFVPLLVMTLGAWLLINIVQWVLRAKRGTRATPTVETHLPQ